MDKMIGCGLTVGDINERGEKAVHLYLHNSIYEKSILWSLTTPNQVWRFAESKVFVHEKILQMISVESWKLLEHQIVENY